MSIPPVMPGSSCLPLPLSSVSMMPQGTEAVPMHDLQDMTSRHEIFRNRSPNAKLGSYNNTN